MYQTSCFLIVANNLLLNYDLIQMIVSPYKRDVGKTIRWVNLIAGAYVTIIYIILPWAKMKSILNTPDSIKLRAEDTAFHLLEGTMLVPDFLLCIFYVAFNIKVLLVLFQNYFFAPGINTQMKNLIINRRITMTLLIMIYEGPFLLVMLRRAFEMYTRSQNEEWQ